VQGYRNRVKLTESSSEPASIEFTNVRPCPVTFLAFVRSAYRPVLGAGAPKMTKRRPRDVGASLSQAPRPERVKSITQSSPSRSSFLVLRSGPVIRHPLLFEEGTIQVDTMSSCESSPIDP
jgi:16S rRNA C967 or C1407 C5-methylase (RsmB/RsmF family)